VLFRSLELNSWGTSWGLRGRSRVDQRILLSPGVIDVWGIRHAPAYAEGGAP
jgi:hypothetical protein